MLGLPRRPLLPVLVLSFISCWSGVVGVAIAPKFRGHGADVDVESGPQLDLDIPRGPGGPPASTRLIDRFATTRQGCGATGVSKAPPALLRRFDWSSVCNSTGGGEQELVYYGNLNNPRSVFTAPRGLKHVLARMEAHRPRLQLAPSLNKSAGPQRVLVVGAADTNLTFIASEDMNTTVPAMVARIRKFFDLVWWEATDVAVEGVHTMPVGLLERYVEGEVADAASKAISDACVDGKVCKPNGVLAAWGAFNPTLGLFDDSKGDFFRPKATNPLTPLWSKISGAASEIESAAKAVRSAASYGAKPLMDTIERSVQSALHVGSDDCSDFKRHACDSRNQAREWAETPAAAAAGVVKSVFSPSVYWNELKNYKFLLSPIGVGIQSPKTMEALLVLTIPIVQRHGFPAHDDLVRYGFPIVVVEKWNEITPESLATWWSTLSPRLKSFRKNCLASEGYWRLLSGQTETCA